MGGKGTRSDSKRGDTWTGYSTGARTMRAGCSRLRIRHRRKHHETAIFRNVGELLIAKRTDSDAGTRLASREARVGEAYDFITVDRHFKCTDRILGNSAIVRFTQPLVEPAP